MYRRKQAPWSSRLKKLPPGAWRYNGLVTSLPVSARASSFATLAPALEGTHLEGKLRIIGEYEGKDWPGGYASGLAPVGSLH